MILNHTSECFGTCYVAPFKIHEKSESKILDGLNINLYFRINDA